MSACLRSPSEAARHVYYPAGRRPRDENDAKRCIYCRRQLTAYRTRTGRLAWR